MFLPTTGAVVGHRYELIEAIGRGGMGEVWRAHDRELDGPCAVKFVLQHLAMDKDVRSRFSREARAVARLRSPHVVDILSVGEQDDVPYLAMELLEGETLQTRLSRIGKLHPRVILMLVEQVADALESAHQAAIVHRDLKPGNIWFWTGNKVFVKVLDFGVAKLGFGAGSLQTATGALVGTPHYMSPEQAMGNRDLDHRSDLWSLAVIVFECLSGKLPFDSTGLGELLVKIVSGSPVPIGEAAPELPPELAPWFERALARDPKDRFQTATEMYESLQALLAGWAGEPTPLRSVAPRDASGSISPVSGRTAQARRSARRGVLGVASAAIIALGVATLQRQLESPRAGAVSESPLELEEARTPRGTPPTTQMGTLRPVTPPSAPEAPPEPAPQSDRTPSGLADSTATPVPAVSAATPTAAHPASTPTGPSGAPSAPAVSPLPAPRPAPGTQASQAVPSPAPNGAADGAAAPTAAQAEPTPPAAPSVSTPAPSSPTAGATAPVERRLLPEPERPKPPADAERLKELERRLGLTPP